MSPLELYSSAPPAPAPLPRVPLFGGGGGVSCILLFCVVVLVLVALVVVTGVQSSLLSRCIVVFFSSCRCSCCCYCCCCWWCAVIIIFFFVVVVVIRRSSSTCHRPPLLVAITVYCCFALLRIVSHCCSFSSDVQPFVHYSNILVSVLISIWPHLDATTGEYCCVRVGRNESDVPLWSTAQEEKKGRG